MAYQVLAQSDLDYPQLSQELDAKEENVEYIYDDSSDDDDDNNKNEGGITYESDSSYNILEKVSKDTVIVEKYENYFKENKRCKKNCRDNETTKKLTFYGIISILALVIVIVVSYKHLRKPLVDPLSSKFIEKRLERRPSISLEDVLDGNVFPHGFNGTWESDDKIIYRDRFANVLLYNVLTNKTSTLVSHDRKPLSQGVTFDLSPDGKYLLIARNLKKRFRRSFSAIYDVLNLETNEVQPLLVNNVQHYLFLATWSPVSNGILINYNYDLYYKSSPNATTETRITFDGSPHNYNGIADWVYEEEVLLSSKATWFNRDGTYVAFIKFNESSVPSIDLPIYGHADDDFEHQYPTRKYIHYPKVGVSNPDVTLIVVNLENVSDFAQISVPRDVTEDHIIATVAWASNDTIVSIFMNRIQNLAVIRSCQVQTKSCKDVATLQSDQGWLDLFAAPLFNGEGTEMAIISSQQGFRHLTMISTQNESKVVLTHGPFVVTKILKWHAESNIIFYTANVVNNSESQHLFAIKGQEGERPQCLTCGLASDFTKKIQKYFDAEFSETGSHLILSFKGPDLPRDYIYTWNYDDQTERVTLSKLRHFQDNLHLERLLHEKSVPLTEFHEIPITGHSFNAKVLLQVPRDIDRSGRIKYPMLVDVYGGPNSVAVTKKFNMDWGSYLASNLSIIYARIDGRGSGLRGDELLHQVYKRLGTVEVQDQINTARKLSLKLPYIDPHRMGIWGWSYGGYVSGMALTKDDQGTFKCGASVAPVTDWAYYDSIYTERYMDLPQNNLKGYLDARLSTRVEGFRRKKYLLIHGTLDDNVHLQQSMALVKKLEKSNIQFKEVSYPDEDHSLAGVRPHLYQTLTEFFESCFGID